MAEHGSHVFKDFMQAANALASFEVARRKLLLQTVRDAAKIVARQTRERAKVLKEVIGARKYNKNIKVIVNTFARYSESQGRVIGGVKTSGLLAKIELGLQARKFWIHRQGGAVFMRKSKKKFSAKAGGKQVGGIFHFKGKGDRWTTVGNVHAGGQTFRKRTLIEMTSGQQSDFALAVNNSIQALADDTM